MREKIDFLFYRSSTFLNAASIRQKDLKHLKLNDEMTKDKRSLSEVHELGHRILYKSMQVLSQDFLSKSVLESEDTFWRVWEIGGTSFGSKMFGHAIYKGKDEGFTPERDSLISFDDYVLKTFWLDCPLGAFRETKRNVKNSWQQEYKILIELSEKTKDGPFPQIWKDDNGNVVEGKSYGIVNIEVPVEFQTLFGETTEVGWIRMEKLNVFTGRTNHRVLESVNELHALGYTHNDLSHKNNIMVRGNNIVLIDFENAKKISDSQTKECEKRIEQDIKAAKELDTKIFNFEDETVEVNINSPSSSRWTPSSSYTTPPPPQTSPPVSGSIKLPESILQESISPDPYTTPPRQ